MMRNVPKPTPSCQLADLLLDGDLANFLREHRSHGDSWETISKKLYVLDPRINVSGQTVQGWFERLAAEVPA